MKIRIAILAAVLAAGCLISSGCASGGGSGADGGSSISAEAEGNINMELKAGDKLAEITVEGYGTIKAKLLPEAAPEGVDNFIKLAEQGYYDGKTVHRVIEDFMLQGGSLNGDGTGGEAADGGHFGIEVNNNARHFYGALCYANAMGRNTTQFYIVNNNEPQDLSDIPIDVIRENVTTCSSYRDMFEQGSTEYEYYDNMSKYYSNLADMLENATEEIRAKYKAEGGTPSLDGGYTVFGQVWEGFEVIDSISACEVTDNGNGEVSKPVQTITITSVKITEYAG